MTERKFGLGIIICIFNKDFSKIFLIKRNKEKRERNKADWGNVGGHLEIGEKIIESCIREAKEEINVNLNPENLKLIEIKEAPFLTEIYHAVWFVYATTIDEKEKIILNNESEDYGWFSLDNLPLKTLDSKENLIRWRDFAKKEFCY